MADGVKLEVSGFKSLNEQLGEAEDRVRNLVNQFGVGSKEVQQAAQEAGRLKQQMMEADKAIESFTTTGKFDALAGGIQGIVGGFAAVQGAMAVVGVESEDLEKTLVKVQGALALVEGVKGVTEFAKSFSTLKTVAVNAFNGIKAAIGSTGIGLLIIGLGIAVGVLIDKLSQASKLEQQNKKDLENLGDAVKEAERAYNNLNTEITRARDIQIAQAELAGASEQKLFDIRAKSIQAQLELVDEQRRKDIELFQQRWALTEQTTKRGEERNKALETLQKEYDDLTAQRLLTEKGLIQELALLDINYQKEAKERNKKAADDRKKAADERKKNELDAAKDLRESIRKFEEERENDARKNAELRVKNDLDRLREARDEELKQENLTRKAKADIMTKFFADSATRILQYNEEIAKIDADAKKEAEDREKAHQEKLADQAQKRFDRGKQVIDDYFKYQQIDLENSLVSEDEYSKKSEQIELDRLQRQLKLAEEAGEDTVDLELLIAQKKRAIRERDLQEQKDAQQAAIDFAFQAATQTVDIFGQAANTRLQNERIAIEARYRSEIDAAGNNAQKIAELEYQMALDMEKINKEQFENEKLLNIARATISGAQAVMNAYATGFAFGPQTAIAFAAIAAALTAAQIGVIASQQYQPAYIKAPGDLAGAAGSGSQYQEGGLLLGAGHDMGGIRTSLGELEGGEFVMNRRSTASFLPLLEQLNALGNEGGPQMASAQASPVIKTYVVASEMTSEQEANARISRLARF